MYHYGLTQEHLMSLQVSPRPLYLTGALRAAAGASGMAPLGALGARQGEDLVKGKVQPPSLPSHF